MSAFHGGAIPYGTRDTADFIIHLWGDATLTMGRNMYYNYAPPEINVVITVKALLFIFLKVEIIQAHIINT